MATVRIADDVNSAYKALAAADPKGRSVTQIVDEQLRIGARMIDPPAETTSRTKPRTKTAPKPAKPQVKATTKTDNKTVKTGPCVVHPPGRIIGDTCMACGHPAKGR